MAMLKRLTILLFILTACSGLFAQTGVIQGQVMDAQSEMSLIGVNIVLDGTDNRVGTVTDLDGYFRLEEVPVGRQTLLVSYLGYEPQVIPNLIVSAGKDLDLEVKLVESLETLETIVIQADGNKERANNEMATISARQFSLEEVRRFSGNGTDVARMVANYAGVASNNDSRNDIIVRGNSPSGVLWRLEGLSIPNPNHFGTLGTTGGPISAINPNVLRNSDFLTSAFPAEYGNATAAVFDLRLRSGNRERGEYSFQMGAFSGLELTAEGPIKKGQSSYLLAGRYSLIGLIGGAAGTTATPIYSDLALKIDLGKTKLGRFELFAMGGPSNIEFIGEDLDDTDPFAETDEDSKYEGAVYVGGLTHTSLIGKNSFWKTTIGMSSSGNTFFTEREQPGEPDADWIRYLDVDNSSQSYLLHTRFNSKINKRLTLRAGVHGRMTDTEASASDIEDNPDLDGDGLPDRIDFYRISGTSSVIEPYAQTLYRVNERLTLNTGIHAQYMDINEQLVIEPRAAIQYALTDNGRLNVGFGLHHQPAAAPILYLKHQENGMLEERNRDLDMIRAQHYVLGYDLNIGNNWRAKAELYYQYLDKIPVDPFASSYSVLTEGADFGFSTDHTDLRNEGTAYSQGVEITVEKFFSKGFYSLLTASVYDSRYTASDGQEYNSPFNNQYVVNLLAGKEFALDANQRKLFFMDTKLTAAGGNFYTPVDIEASRMAGVEVLDDNRIYADQHDDYFRWDVKFGMRLNSPSRRLSQRFYVDILNILNNQNVFLSEYDAESETILNSYQRGFFADFGYRIEF